SFMLMHAVLSILLAKHSNSTDIVIGTPIANRMQRELESLIGFFVNTLALRTQLSGEIEFSEFLSKVKQVNLDAQQHQDAPFEQILDKLSLGGSQSYTPLVQVMLSVGEDSKLGLAVNNDVTFSVLEQEESYAKFDLQLSVSLGESGARLSWIYDSELFTADSIARLDSYFQRLLASVVATPMAKLSELEMLSEVEQQTLATCLEGEQVSYADEVQLHELFEAQVAHSPDALAVRYENTELSYAALNARANGLAAELRQLGVTNEVLVGVYLPRGVAALVAILAVLKAGGAYVPLDPSYPSERLQHIVDDTDMSLVIGGEASGFDGSMARLQQVDCTAWVEDEVDLSVANLQPLGTAESLAYVMYTSGSTGRPKGV
ncbi:condensation domain-containing protein, partial [Pseudoalteromonas sp. 2CM41L]|uniref:condensation domain-containing protein n=1 Tax=Pseudoalteromonas sp. 2CM41L TaxID=2929857 RepID=UPI0020BFFE91